MVQIHQGPPRINTFMEQNKKPIQEYYYSENEWDRLGCGPLPAERNKLKQLEDIISRGNPIQDGKNIKGYN